MLASITSKAQKVKAEASLIALMFAIANVKAEKEASDVVAALEAVAENNGAIMLSSPDEDIRERFTDFVSSYASENPTKFENEVRYCFLFDMIKTF